MSSDYGPAQWIPTQHFWAGRGGHQPRWIIVHGTAGGNSADGVARYFQTNDPPTSTHFVIGLDGAVVQCVAEADSAWGNGVVTQGHDPWWSADLNPNFVTFSIEHVKPDTHNNSQLTDAQKKASFALIQHLCAKYNIPARAADASGGITGHYSIDPVNRQFCPGPYPWDELWAFLRGSGGGTNVGIPAGWHDDGTTLSAPNGIKVTLGFRWYIMTHPWASDNWPLEPEHYASPVDVTNPQWGAGTLQHFRQSVLIWRESTGDIYEMWAGAAELAWQQRALAAEQALAARQAAPVTSAPTPAAGAPPPIVVAPVSPVFTPPRPGAAARSSDPVAQRINSLEQQIGLLLKGLSSNPATKKVITGLGKESADIARLLADAQTKAGIPTNPRSFLRWGLMILGLLFSDAITWIVSSLTHQSGGIQLPFLTIGTIGTVVSGLVFLTTFGTKGS